mgnify:FL=1
MNQTTFPYYRKLKNGKSFYKISGERTFTEIQCVGNQYFKIEIIANKYPEIILIQDMLIKRGIYDLSTEEEFNTIEDKLADK